MAAGWTRPEDSVASLQQPCKLHSALTDGRLPMCLRQRDVELLARLARGTKRTVDHIGGSGPVSPLQLLTDFSLRRPDDRSRQVDEPPHGWRSKCIERPLLATVHCGVGQWCRTLPPTQHGVATVNAQIRTCACSSSCIFSIFPSSTTSSDRTPRQLPDNSDPSDTASLPTNALKFEYSDDTEVAPANLVPAASNPSKLAHASLSSNAISSEQTDHSPASSSSLLYAESESYEQRRRDRK